MGFFDDVGNYLFGGPGQQRQGQGTQAAGAQTLGTVAAADPAQRAAQALAVGKQAGAETGKEAAEAGTAKALQAARGAGLNPAQAAQVAAPQAGQAYTAADIVARSMGTAAGTTAQQQQIEAAREQAAVGGQQVNQGAQSAGNLLSGIGGLASVLLSDRRSKKDIGDAKTLDEAAEKIPEKEFEYKDGDGEKQVGVMAQDVEKVDPQNVVETPAGKAIDVARQTGTNTARLMELAQRVKALEGKIRV